MPERQGATARPCPFWTVGYELSMAGVEEHDRRRYSAIVLLCALTAAEARAKAAEIRLVFVERWSAELGHVVYVRVSDPGRMTRHTLSQVALL